METQRRPENLQRLRSVVEALVVPAQNTASLLAVPCEPEDVVAALVVSAPNLLAVP